MVFSEILRSMSGSGGDWTVNVPDTWGQGRAVFGGLGAAIAARAMRGLVPAGVPLRTLQVTFIGPMLTGESQVRAQVLRTGKSATHVEARIHSGGQMVCCAIAVFGLARSSALNIEPPAPKVGRTPEQSREFPYIEGVTPSFTRYMEMRWASGGMLFSGASEARTQIYTRMRGDPVVDEASIIGFADVIPSPGLSMLKKPAPASSLTWMLEFARHDFDPDPQAYWLMDAEVTTGSEGYLNQTATLWSPQGKAVALSRQSVVVFG